MIGSAGKIQVSFKLLCRLLLIVIVAAISSKVNADDPNYRFAYYANGRICVDRLPEINGKNPIRSHQGTQIPGSGTRHVHR